MSEARPLIFALIEDARDLPLVKLGSALGEVIAISVSAPVAERDPLVLSIALGATRAVRAWDAALAGVDYLGIAHVLACAVRHLAEAPARTTTDPVSPVVVLAGDRGRGAVGPALAERLAVPHLGAVRGVELADGQLIAARLCGNELRRFAGKPPAVLVCTLAAPVMPDATPDGADTSRPIEELTLATLQITAPELQYRRRFKPAPGSAPRHRPHLVSNIELLGDRLARDGLWPLPDAPRTEGEH